MHGRRLRMTAALTSLMLVTSSIGGPTAWAQSSSYSGESTSTAVTVVTEAPGGTSVVTVGETTTSINSHGGIVGDDARTPQDESDHVVVATATPLRVDEADHMHNPASIQGGAPGDVDGGTAAAGVEAVDGDGDTAATAGLAVTGIDATTNLTTDDLAADGTVLEESRAGLEASVGSVVAVAGVTVAGPADAEVLAAASISTIDRAEDGEIAATSGAALLPSSFFGGLVTVEQVVAAVAVAAHEGGGDAGRSMSITNLRLFDTAGGTALLTVTGQSLDSGAQLRLTITLNDGATTTTSTLTVPAGIDLLDPAVYTGTDLEAAFTSLGPALPPLTGVGGPLQDLQILLAAGFTDVGANWARALIDGVTLVAAPNGGDQVTIALASAYAGVDAVRAFSTATDPTWPVGVTPVSDADRAFPATRSAVPAANIVAEDVAEGKDLAGTTVVLAATQLPLTGLGVLALALLGIACLASGAAVHLRRARHQ